MLLASLGVALFTVPGTPPTKKRGSPTQVMITVTFVDWRRNREQRCASRFVLVLFRLNNADYGVKNG